MPKHDIPQFTNFLRQNLNLLDDSVQPDGVRLNEKNISDSNRLKYYRYFSGENGVAECEIHL